MKKTYNLSLLALLFGLLFFAKNGTAQTNARSEKNQKTVVYKIKKQGEQKTLTTNQVIEIDKLLISKKGVLSSTTNGATRLVTVKVGSDFPEVEINKILRSVLHLEVESFEITDNTK